MSETPALSAARSDSEFLVTRSLVSELRSFSRADGETRKHVDLASVVQSAIKMVGNEIRHRAQVVTSFEPVRAALANEARLEQVVVNLLLNALQAMPEGTAAKNVVRVCVRQDGERRAVPRDGIHRGA